MRFPITSALSHRHERYCAQFLYSSNACYKLFEGYQYSSNNYSTLVSDKFRYKVFGLML